MDLESVMRELESLGTAHTKKSYLSRGVREPVFGVATGAMKPLKKRIGVDQPLAEQLWATDNFDAMYLAGMVADVGAMSPADFDRWIADAYCALLADGVVAVTLAESDVAQDVAAGWIRGGDADAAAAGWACHEWLVGWRPDDFFDPEAIRALLRLAADTIHTAPARVQRAMNNTIVAIGVSYLPLHEEALAIADAIGPVQVVDGDTTKTLKSAAEQIRAAAEKGRLGFKRRAVRC